MSQHDRERQSEHEICLGEANPLQLETRKDGTEHEMILSPAPKRPPPRSTGPLHSHRHLGLSFRSSSSSSSPSAGRAVSLPFPTAGNLSTSPATVVPVLSMRSSIASCSMPSSSSSRSASSMGSPMWALVMAEAISSLSACCSRSSSL